MGRWITGPPTLSSYISVRTSSFWPPAWSICSISLLDSSFSLRAFGAYQGCHTETIGRRDSAVHTRTLCENKGQLNKTKQSVMTLVEQDNLDDMLLNRSIPATKKKKRLKDTVFSAPLRQIPPLYRLESRLSVRRHPKQGHGPKMFKCIAHCPLT